MTIDSTKSPETTNSLITTAVVFGLITIFVYFVFLKPFFSSEQPAAAAVATRGQRQQQQQQRRTIPSNTNQQTNTTNTTTTTAPANATSYSWTRNYQKRQPPHAIQTTISGAGTTTGRTILVDSDGLVSFRYTTAAAYEVAMAGLDDETIAANRKERARVLSRILAMESTTITSNKLSPPPPRGVTAVVTIPTDDLKCHTLRRVLYLLGTYFNLIVVLSVVEPNPTNHNKDKNDNKDETTKRIAEQIKSYIQTLRGEFDGENSNSTDLLPRQVLPDHRIIVAQSRMGRIALVRQLGDRVAFVLEYEPETKQELERFGFKVLVYGDDSNKTKPTNASSNNHHHTSRLAARLMLSEPSLNHI